VSDVTIPSYRVPREGGAGAVTRRLLLAAVGVLGLAAAAGAVAWGLNRAGAPRVVPARRARAAPLFRAIVSGVG
jgi:hypothetical protein